MIYVFDNLRMITEDDARQRCVARDRSVFRVTRDLSLSLIHHRQGSRLSVMPVLNPWVPGRKIPERAIKGQDLPTTRHSHLSSDSSSSRSRRIPVSIARS